MTENFTQEGKTKVPRCIVVPVQLPMLIVRDEYLIITNGDPCAAALLNYFEHWTNTKLARGEDPIIWNTHDELFIALAGCYKMHVIRTARTLLATLDYITIAPSPHAGDRTSHYRINADIVQAAVDEVFSQLSPVTDGTPSQLSPAAGELSPATVPTVTGSSSTLDIDYSSEITPEIAAAGAHARPFAAAAKDDINPANDEKVFAQTTPVKVSPPITPAAPNPPPPIPPLPATAKTFASDLPPLLKAFIAATPEHALGTVTHDMIAEAKALEGQGVCPEDVSDLLRVKWADPGRVEYSFRWIKNDIRGFRAGREKSKSDPVITALASAFERPKPEPLAVRPAAKDPRIGWNWSAAYEQMRSLLSPAAFEMNLRRAQLVDYDAGEQRYVIVVANESAKSAVNGLLNRQLCTMLKQTSGEVSKVEAVTREEWEAQRTGEGVEAI